MPKMKEKAKKAEEVENEEIDQEEIDQEEVDEEEEPQEDPPKKAVKKLNIMDSADSAEPPKRKAKKEVFENKLDLTPVLSAINNLGEQLKEKPKKKTEKTEEKGFFEALGDW